MKLNSGQKNLLRLVAKGADTEGWAKVSSVVWPLIAALPDDLVEKRPSENGGHVRLTAMTATLDNKWIDDVCKLGHGAACCRYLVCGPDGFECAKFSEVKSLLDSRAAAGTMHARGNNCPGKVHK